jgi:multidrug efflux pump subunit AcrA (membrane-fusion protein)
MRYKFRYLLFLPVCITVFFSCKSNEAKKEETASVAGTPVTVATVSTEPLLEYVDLNATSAFLIKSYVKANVNGYIETVNTQPGKFVATGQRLFVIKTKEAQNIGNTVNKLDPSFRFSGINNIKATTSGYVTQLNHQQGDYVQDGEQLAVISDANSFAFLLNLPYELRPYIVGISSVEVVLPDSTKLKGVIASAMPTVDPASQTQNYIIKVTANNIPENLIAKVRILKSKKENSNSLPKSALLTNDVQSEFWVMKLIDSVTAVKIPVVKGLETKDRVEIIAPVFTPADKILITGNYGLPDTAKVKLIP